MITFLPLKSAKETDFKSADIKVNCGAGWPMVNDISFFLQINENKIEVAEEIILRIKFYILNIY
jgi:hypothetical protein